jgi:hypothetical protein
MVKDRSQDDSGMTGYEVQSLAILDYRILSKPGHPFGQKFPVER